MADSCQVHVTTDVYLYISLLKILSTLKRSAKSQRKQKYGGS